LELGIVARERGRRVASRRAVVAAIFVRGYLTTPGQSSNEARQMIEEMGFEVETAIGSQLPAVG
jgi:biotin synthase-like enzyme